MEETNVYHVYKANSLSELKDFIEGRSAFDMKIVSVTQQGDSYTVIYYFK